jgi:pimeloyl-ACP methyl ester carboxylesterase
VKRVVFVLLGLLAAAVALPVSHGVRAYLTRRNAYTPRRWAVQRPPDAALLGLRDVRFTGRDGTRLAGWYIPSHNGAAVILSHGSDADRSSMMDEARPLAAAGFGLLLFDAPGHGESDGRIELGQTERSALLGAVDLVLLQPDITRPKVGVLGFSDGAYIAAGVAPTEPRIGAVLLEGAYGNVEEQIRNEFAGAGRMAQWGAVLADRHVRGDAPIRPQQPASGVSHPFTVIVSGSADHTVPTALGRELYNAERTPRDFWVIPGVGHGGYVGGDPAYASRMVAFFQRGLLEAR